MDKKNPTEMRSGLRLIVSNPSSKTPVAIDADQTNAPAEEAVTTAAKKNPLVSFMSAYADAIDRDVEMILGL